MGKIVIFENTVILGNKMKKLLADYGMEDVHILRNFNTYKNKADAALAGASCFIVDLDNRNQDTMQLIGFLKTGNVTEKVPIITLSTNVSIAMLKNTIKAGCTDFILKPFETETLVNKIYKVCYQEDMNQAEEKEYQLGDLFHESGITLKWTKDFEIGVEQIDTEHRDIIEYYDKLYSMMRVGQGHEYYHELLDFLKTYVNTHFEHEEQLLININFDQYESHKELHDRFRARVDDILANHKGEAITSNELISISLFIKDWLLHHILLEDKKIKDFI